MIKYAKVINNVSGLCETAEGSNIDFYKSIGMTQLDVEQSEKDNNWYLASKCPHYTPEEKAQQREADFNKQFFSTSLGYIRRTVTMKDGTKKSFLTDILPMLVEGVPVLVYTRELEQSKVLVTTEFINECKQQLLKDFYGEE